MQVKHLRFQIFQISSIQHKDLNLIMSGFSTGKERTAEFNYASVAGYAIN